MAGSATAMPVLFVRWLSLCMIASTLPTGWSSDGVASMKDAGGCGDVQNMCYKWFLQGDCESNQEYMEANCAASCGTGVCKATGQPAAKEASTQFSVRFSHAAPTKSALEILWVPPNMKKEKKPPTLVATIEKGSSATLKTFDDHVFLVREATSQKKIAVARMYSGREELYIDKAFLDTRHKCEDQRPDCKTRAPAGQCVGGPGWMTVHCPKSCHACHLTNPEKRCARDQLNVIQNPAIQPGYIDTLFEGLEDRFPQFNVTYHNKREPWIVTFDNFVTEEEMTGLLGTLGGKFARSTDQGGFDERGVQSQVTSTGRTSENAWCQEGCQDHPAPLAIMDRIRQVTGVPTVNYEQFQVLSYKQGQFYNAHNDMSESDNKMPAGPRIFTFFLYFSDVEVGGETNFPKVNVSIRPKRGSALFWNDVKSANPTKMEPKSLHQAVPVEQGHKLAANAWVHMWNYREPNRWGCTGSFA